MDEVIALMRGTVIGREAIGGETVCDARVLERHAQRRCKPSC